MLHSHAPRIREVILLTLVCSCVKSECGINVDAFSHLTFLNLNFILQITCEPELDMQFVPLSFLSST